MQESSSIRWPARLLLPAVFFLARAFAADPAPAASPTASASPAPVATAGTPFTQQANVVILAGLPGDIESEHRFEEEAKQLLDSLARKEDKPKSVHVLIDDPTAITLPQGLDGDVKQASRDNFLALAKTLDAASPLVVFAWGHAGMIRDTPVLHVRGERITPADFATLAAATAKAPSRWMLIFRGSGSFAKAVRSENTDIVSSELDTVFGSDPVSVDILTGILHEHAGLDFPTLASLYGQKTVAWYNDKNLARQEEPTLWHANDDPKMIAQMKPATVAVTSGTDGSPSTAPAAGAWGDVKPVDPAQFPDDAVVLRRSIQYVLGESPAISEERDEYIQILTANGKEYGDFDISYSPPEETVTFLDCEVRRPDGTIISLDPDEIREAQNNNDLGDYHTEHRKIFSLPHVEPGAILHVHYRSEWKRSPLPHSFLEIPLAQSIPIVDQRIEVRLSSKSAFHFIFDDAAAQDPVLSKSREPRVAQ
ncbi:MAG TPA: DUF3857 domain-containing protein, partial [Chthoniobacteraceae bacterium]|nr:DUF3857 domain-containing protein [Chthoniobacteraceae bacterium]